MATNAYGQTYVGNDDFRGWLAAGNYNQVLTNNAASYNPQTGKLGGGQVRLIDIVGNDGKTNGTIAGADKLAQQAYNEWLSQRSSPQAAGGNFSGSGGSGGGGSASNYDANAVNYWNNTISQRENELNGLSGLLDELNLGTDSQYNTKKNELQSAYNRAESGYNLGSTQNKQSLQTNKNTIADRASQGLRGLLRTLGAMGAGGSSSAMYNAPELVTAQANQERTGANQTFGENAQKLDTNWGNYQIDHDNDKKQLEDWRVGSQRENEQKVLTQRNSLLATLADAYAQRGSAGQGAGNRINEITSQINANTNRLNELNKFQAPQYNGVRAVYEAPSLSSYNTGNADITTQVTDAPQAGQSGNITPTLAMLMGLRNRKDTNPYGRR